MMENAKSANENNKQTHIPQLLLIGNGINRAFNGDSWKEVLNAIKKRDDIDVDKLKAPMPLQAVLLTGNKVLGAVEKYKEKFFGKPLPQDECELIDTILDAGFDEILTTNYSYELEACTETGRIPTEQEIIGMTRFRKYKERQAEETKYLLHTYNLRKDAHRTNRIWHIHGEARKPDSIIIGHFYYANLLKRMQDVSAKSFNDQWDSGDRECRSWVDSFMFGDVYILGFGFDFSEFDLWWLINRKQREKDICKRTKIYWFEPEIKRPEGEIDEKRELLKSMGVVCENIGFIANSYAEIDFKEFYRKAVKRIIALKKENLQKAVSIEAN